MRRRAVVLLLLVLAGMTGDRLADHPPSWLHDDPLLRPLGLAAPPLSGADGGDSTAAPPPLLTRAAPLHVNSATAAELRRLPRIGPVLARRILARRDSLGAFREPSDLLAVRGIGPSILATIETLLTFHSCRVFPLQSALPADRRP